MVDFYEFLIGGPEIQRLYDNDFDNDEDIHIFGTSKNERIYLSWFKSVLYTTPRDFCLLSTVKRLPNGSLVVCAKSIVNSECPPVNGRVRADLITSGFLLEPISDNPPRTRLSNLLLVDPAGGIPKWIINTQAASRPLIIADMANCSLEWNKNKRKGTRKNELGRLLYTTSLYQPPSKRKTSSEGKLSIENNAKKDATVVVPVKAPYTSNLYYICHGLNPYDERGALPVGSLRLKVIMAKGLKSTDLNGLSDPYLGK